MEWNDRYEEGKRKAVEARNIAKEQVESWSNVLGGMEQVVEGYRVADQLLSMESKTEVPPLYIQTILDGGSSTSALHAAVVSESLRGDAIGWVTSGASLITAGIDRAVYAGVLSPSQEAVADAYTHSLNVKQEIAYLHDNLARIDTEVAEDFVAFIHSYQYPDPQRTKYQVLIGLRSLMFNKLIQRVSRKHGIRGDGRWADRVFAFIVGSAGVSDPEERKAIGELAAMASNLHKTLSTDTKSGEKGARHVERVFKESVLLLSAIVRQHISIYRGP
jgi:hypothetical protein